MVEVSPQIRFRLSNNMSFWGWIIPLAQAAPDSAAFGNSLKPIIDNILSPILYFLFTLAVFIFAYGIVEMMVKGNDGEARGKGRRHMLAGIFGMFIMLSAWGIVTLVSDSLKSISSDARNASSSSGPSQTIDPAGELNI